MVEYKLLMSLLEQQSELYKPGPFWQKASIEIYEDLISQGLAGFRSLPTPLNFFVPTYGFPGNGVSRPLATSLQEWLDDQELTAKQRSYFDSLSTGHSAALADYRSLAASEYGNTSELDLMKFSEGKVGDPIEQFEFEGKFHSRSSLNYLMGLSFLKKFMDFSNVSTVMEIGGGYGTLGEILHQVSPRVRYINLDIPPTLFFSSYYLGQVIGPENITLYDDLRAEGLIYIDQLKKIANLPSWEIERLHGGVDLFVNFISFQEMEPEIVKNYLIQVKRFEPNWILLRNMREGKQLRSKDNIGVNKPVLSESYLDMLRDYSLVESNVIPYGTKTVDGYHSELMLFKKNGD